MPDDSPFVPPAWTAPTIVFALLLSAIIATTQRFSVTAIATATFLIGGLYQIRINGVPTEFWAHILFGLVLASATGYVLRGDGGPLAIRHYHGVILVVVAISILVGEVHATHIGSVHSFAHVVIVTLMLSIGLAAAVAGSRPPSKKIATIRALHDSVALAGIGLTLMRHLHDTAPLSVRVHQVQGIGLILLGASTLVSSLVHARLPRDDAAATLVRLCCAMLWCLNALWLCVPYRRSNAGRSHAILAHSTSRVGSISRPRSFHMACFIYIWPGRKGLHVYLWPTADPDESVVIYLAANSWLATLIIAAWYCAYGTAPLEPPHALQQMDHAEAAGSSTGASTRCRVAPLDEEAGGNGYEQGERAPLVDADHDADAMAFKT